MLIIIYQTYLPLWYLFLKRNLDNFLLLNRLPCHRFRYKCKSKFRLDHRKNLIGGFRDITRIASSSPIMWEQICVENNQNISNVLDDYIRLLVQIRCFVDNKDSKSLYQMFANSRDYRDSIDVVDNGLLKKAYVLYLDIADEAGGIATIATILAMEKISIKNIGIIHNREFEEGVLKIEFYDGTAMEKGAVLLKKRNYIVYER